MPVTFKQTRHKARIACDVSKARTAWADNARASNEHILRSLNSGNYGSASNAGSTFEGAALNRRCGDHFTLRR